MCVCQRRLSAFLRFSLPTTPGAAPRLTALAVPADDTFESAVPRGEGESTRSLPFSSPERDEREDETEILLEADCWSGWKGGDDVTFIDEMTDDVDGFGGSRGVG